GYRDLIVKRGPNGTPVYLRDVARVVDGVENERLSRHFFVRNFQPPASVIVFAVSRQAGANAVQVAKSVRALLPGLQRELPGSIRLIPVFDRSQSIVNSLHDVQFTLVLAFALVIFVIFVFLGRASDTLIPMVALPMSFLITFVAMLVLGYSINNLTLMARGAGHRKTWPERFVERYFNPIRDAYGRTLHWFLDRGWIAAPVLIACVIGVWFFFKQLPFTLLPTGDSGTIRGFFIVQEGASPAQQRQLQTQLDPILQANPAVDKYFTVAGRSGLGAGVFTVLFLKDKKERADIETVAAQLRKACSSIPGVLPTLNPQPVLQINIGAAGSQFGRYSYVISGIDPKEVYDAADK